MGRGRGGLGSAALEGSVGFGTALEGLICGAINGRVGPWRAFRRPIVLESEKWLEGPDVGHAIPGGLTGSFIAPDLQPFSGYGGHQPPVREPAGLTAVPTVAAFKDVT